MVSILLSANILNEKETKKDQTDFPWAKREENCSLGDKIADTKHWLQGEILKSKQSN